MVRMSKPQCACSQFYVKQRSGHACIYEKPACCSRVQLRKARFTYVKMTKRMHIIQLYFRSPLNGNHFLVFLRFSFLFPFFFSLSTSSFFPSFILILLNLSLLNHKLELGLICLLTAFMALYFLTYSQKKAEYTFLFLSLAVPCLDSFRECGHLNKLAWLLNTIVNGLGFVNLETYVVVAVC